MECACTMEGDAITGLCMSHRIAMTANGLDASESLRDEVERLKHDLATSNEKTCKHGWRGSVPEDARSILDPCPSCGSHSLFIGKGGYLTCSILRGCSEPTVTRAIKDIQAHAEKAERRGNELHLELIALTATSFHMAQEFEEAESRIVTLERERDEVIASHATTIELYDNYDNEFEKVMDERDEARDRIALLERERDEALASCRMYDEVSKIERDEAVRIESRIVKLERVLTDIAEGNVSKANGGPDIMEMDKDDFRHAMWTWSQKQARAALSAPQPVAADAKEGDDGKI